MHTKHEIDAVLQELLDRLHGYRAEADTNLVRRAYEFAYGVHDGQLRQSGEPYIVHPLQAAHILADIESDEHALAACLLHDTVEDCAQDEEREIKRLQREMGEAEEGASAADRRRAAELSKRIQSLEHVVERVKEEVGQHLHEEFGQTISDLVDGVTRLSEVRFYELQGTRRPGEAEGRADKNEELRRRLQAENLRRMVVAAAKDPRVLVIKLADRLHNMQTLYAKRRPKQLKIARETEVIYCKLADRLGIWRIKWEMEDLVFRYLDPDAYAEIERRVAKSRDERMSEIESACRQIRDKLTAEQVQADVYGRPKHLYSIWSKMRRQGIVFDEIYDLEAIRIITDSPWSCYKALYVVHSLWPHQPEHFADYISNRKPNGYSSLHTKVIVPGHGPMEVQIRTADMHRQAEYGVAAHWRYKEDGVIDEGFANKLTALRRLFEAARASEPVGLPGAGDPQDDEQDWLEAVEGSLFEEDVFVFTPKGEIIDLPKGATVIDFAYRIHTAVGHTTIGARVNRRMVPLDYVLQNGEQVEVLRRANTGPSRDWLKVVRTTTARNRIRQYFRHKERESLAEEGQRLLEGEASRAKVDLNDLYRRDRELPATYRRRAREEPVEDLLTRIARRRNYQTDIDLLTAVGDRVIAAEGVVKQMVADLEEAETAAGRRTVPPPAPSGVPGPPSSAAAASVQGLRGLAMRRSQCCLPLPGDPIVGYVTRTTGITIHRADCGNLRHLQANEPDRVMPLDWDQTEHLLYDLPIELRADDRIGLLADLTKMLSDVGINILRINTISPKLNKAGTDHRATMKLSLELNDRSQLEQLMRRLPALGVVKVSVRGQVYYDVEKSARKPSRDRSRKART
ncbi:MAG: bifunctional (p)ppGpp synthetase/guanosine-3',5'-bis(diphosphate) 3'-pyrophosphohydrolase [Fimbriimonadaceae bacterium]|nr:bifunctional (p)ppGpp synthetase/guanosine-3',5'-bis(diphosphate) 3'-pyrophosphohydrolase [Fimbriimonadaceae bacterium]